MWDTCVSETWWPNVFTVAQDISLIVILIAEGAGSGANALSTTQWE